MAEKLSLTQAFRLTFADRAIALTLIVSALGYFVDIFDLLLFSIVRVQSLRDLGVAEDQLLSVGIQLLNAQMAGLLLGGVIWGIIGDKFGRVRVLLASILLYSLGNIANGFVTSVTQYEILRFITGFGLAGELGIAVTLASELLPKNVRGLGTTFIATMGVMGAVAAALVAEHMGWRSAYITGGVMGLLLLILRIKVTESELFKKTDQAIPRGNLLLFCKNFSILKKYIAVILIGAPLWATVGLFITFTPEFAKDFGMTTLPTAGMAVLFCYLGLTLGDLSSGTISQYLQSRKKAVGLFLGLLSLFIVLFVAVPHSTLPLYYFFCFLLGIGCGYWAMFVQMGAEQFGTNIRATAATSIPNFVRAITIPAAASFHGLIPHFGVTQSGLIVVGTCMVLAFIALYSLKETFHTDLDYTDH